MKADWYLLTGDQLATFRSGVSFRVYVLTTLVANYLSDKTTPYPDKDYYSQPNCFWDAVRLYSMAYEDFSKKKESSKEFKPPV